MIDMQALMDGMSARRQKERAASQMTLGNLIDALELLDGKLPVQGFGGPISYRGYYCDLAFEPSEGAETVDSLLAKARACMGEEFTGYKGGEFMMGRATPLWIAPYGSSGERLMGLNTEGSTISPITAPDED